MDTNIEISNINKHFYTNKTINQMKSNNEDSDDSEELYEDNGTSKYNKKLISYDFFSINEINISNEIKKIPYYSRNYSIVETHDFVNISKLSEDFIEKMDISKDIRYLIFNYKKGNFERFNDYLLKFTDPKIFILNTIETFSRILNYLIKLNEHNICFFNLSPQNIIFDLGFGEVPKLHNFQLSFQIYSINEAYITNIIKHENDYVYKPLEVHVLFYLIHNDMVTMSYSFIEEICEVFVKNLTILDLFSLQFKETYKQMCVETIKKYINKSKSAIIYDILQSANKWDVYSLSVLYIHIFGNISRIFSLKQTFINKITLELSKNIHPDPSKRTELKSLLEKLNILLNNEDNWSFLKNIEPNQIRKLFGIFNHDSN
jgi:hypothetical protein